MDKDDKDLLAWYRCEDITGNVLVNEIGGTLPGTCTNITLVSGGAFRDGKSAISFNGTSSIVAFGGSTNLFNNAGVQTVCLWYKADPQLSDGRIFAHTEATDGNRLYITLDNSSFVSCTVGTTGINNINGSVTPDDGNWHHIAVVRDATNNKAWCYFDGVLTISNQDITITNPNSQELVNLGSQGATDWFTGEIDDVRIYNRFLTDAEVKYIIHGRGAA